jgi:hypothetical protein
MEKYFPLRKDLSREPLGYNEFVERRILESIIEIRERHDEFPCLIWNHETTRLWVSGKKLQCHRFIFEFCVGKLESNQRVYQTCSTDQICIQPKHLYTCSTNKETEEWKKHKQEKRVLYNQKRKDKRRLEKLLNIASEKKRRKNEELGVDALTKERLSELYDSNIEYTSRTSSHIDDFHVGTPQYECITEIEYPKDHEKDFIIHSIKEDDNLSDITSLPLSPISI